MNDQSATSIAAVLAAIVLGITMLHYAATWYYWYITYAWIDIPLHIMGGAFIGILFYYLFVLRFPLLPRTGAIPLLTLLIFGTGFVMLMGVAWELYEFWANIFLFKKYVVASIPGWVHADTLLDLVNDGIGGVLALGSVWFVYERK